MTQAVRDALLDGFGAALVRFANFLDGVPPEALDAPMPGKDPSVRDVLAHVVDAAYRHVIYVARNCGGSTPTRQFQLEDRRDLAAVRIGLTDAVRHARAALATVDDAALRGPRFAGRGGGDYDGEQMLEHAIVHLYRHERQLRRHGFGRAT